MQFELTSAFAQNSSSAAADSKSNEATQENVKPKFRKGVFRGDLELFDLDKNFIVLKPFQKGKSATFYLDRFTLYRLDKKRANKKQLALGQHVAVRFFGKDYLYVADEVCIATERFEKDHCKRVLPVRRKKAE